MAERTVYRVLHREDRWILKRDGHENPAAWSLEKERMIERGVELCDAVRPARLVIHRRRHAEVDEIRVYPASSVSEYQRLEGGPAT